MNYNVSGSPGRVEAINMINGKRTVILSDAVDPIQYGKYLIVRKYAEFSPSGLYVYDAGKNKKIKISNRVTAYKVINGKLYYAEWNKSESKVTVKCCSLNGKNKKSLTTFSGDPYTTMNIQIGPKYVIYGQDDFDSPSVNYYKITYLTKKITRSSYKALKKVVEIY